MRGDADRAGDPLQKARTVLDGRPDPEVVDSEAKAAEARGETGASMFIRGDSAFVAGDDVSTETTTTLTSTTREVATPESALPLGQLDALRPEERREFARRRGCEWLTTEEARDRLREKIHEVVRHEDNRVVRRRPRLGSPTPSPRNGGAPAMV